MGKKYANFLGNVEVVLGQCGAMEKHLADALADLERLKGDLSDKTDFTRAKRDLRRANNAGRRISQFFDRVKEDIEKIKNDDGVVKEDRNKLGDFEEKIRPHEAALTAETSYCVGELGDDVDGLGV